jgi:pimeloyl-ACP methyl ester carboxylesterase
MIHFQNIDGLNIACWLNSMPFVDGKKNLVFIHGSGGDHTTWVYQYSRMKNNYNIAALELPSHGQSEGGGEQSILAYVEWVKKIIERLGISKPILIGHSMGAAIAMTFAIHYGDRLSGLVSVCGGAKMKVNPLIFEGLKTDPKVVIDMAAKFSLSKKNFERLSRPVTESLSKIPPDIIYGDFMACDQMDLTQSIEQIHVPTLIICGADDKMTPPSLSSYLKDQIPGAQLAKIEDAGHFVMMENPEVFNEVLENFIQSVP